MTPEFEQYLRDLGYIGTPGDDGQMQWYGSGMEEGNRINDLSPLQDSYNLFSQTDAQGRPVFGSLAYDPTKSGVGGVINYNGQQMRRIGEGYANPSIAQAGVQPIYDPQYGYLIPESVAGNIANSMNNYGFLDSLATNMPVIMGSAVLAGGAGNYFGGGAAAPAASGTTAAAAAPAAGGLSAETLAWMQAAGYTPSEIASIGSQFGAGGALTGMAGEWLSSDLLGRIGEADLGQNPAEFTGAGGTGTAASGKSWWDKLFAPSGSGGDSKSALGRLFGLSGTGSDVLDVLGKAGIAGLGAYTSNRQADKFADLANEYKGFGAPYRQRLADLYANPQGFLSSPEVQVPLQQGTDALARSLSVKSNPAGSGNALQELQNYASGQLFGRLGQEKDRLAGYGGLAGYNAAAPALQSNAITQQGKTLADIGGGLSDVFSPPKTTAQQFADFMKMMKAY